MSAPRLIGEIVDHEGVLCVQTAPRVWYPLDGSSGIAEDFRETFNRAQRSDLGKRLYYHNGVICMESVEQMQARKVIG